MTPVKIHRIIDAVEQRNCGNCFFAMPIEPEGLRVVGQDMEKVFFCMRNPPAVWFMPTQQRVAGGGPGISPISQFPPVKEQQVCGEHMHGDDAEV